MSHEIPCKRTKATLLILNNHNYHKHRVTTKKPDASAAMDTSK